MRWPQPVPGRVRWSWLLGTWLRRRRVRRVLKLLTGCLAPDPVILDVGSGPGFSSRELLRMAPVPIRRQILLDPQRGMFDRFVRDRSNSRPSPAHALEPMVGDATRLPIKNEGTQVLLSLGVLCCMTEPAIDPAIEESWRVLSPGGFFLLGVPKRRGRKDEARLTARGFIRRAGIRAGLSLFQKPIYPTSPIPA